MIKTFTNNTLFIEENTNPELRDLLETLARDQDYSNITWYNEDNTGEIEIFMYETFGDDLEVLLFELQDSFEEDKELKEVDGIDREQVSILADLRTLANEVIIPQNVYYNKY